MKKELLNNIIFYSLITLFLIDILIKSLVEVINIPYVINTGMSFSLLPNSTPVFMILGFVIIFAMSYYKDIMAKISMNGSLAIMLGVFSNTIDRSANNGVTDYIFTPLFTNNIADILMFCGVAWICYKVWYTDILFNLEVEEE